MASEEIPAPKHSETVQLVLDIEGKVKGAWNQELRHEVAELIRQYRFNQVGSVVLRIQQLVRDAGNADLSQKLFMGKY